jgi:pyrroline-5-carboxylate reductase
VTANLPPILLVGAGRMGGAMFAGWCARGLAPSVLLDPSLPKNLARDTIDILVPDASAIPQGFQPSAVILAIKPQMASLVIPTLTIPPQAVVLSVLAGIPIAKLATLLATPNPIVRTMPNTPAAIGQGITGAFASPIVSDAQKHLCTELLAAVGDVAWFDSESLIDPLTAISGCGPAYVFLLAEILEQVAIEHGLPADLARRLARKTVSGSGALLAASPQDAADLRKAVTSPHGVTQKALEKLMASEAWPKTLRDAVQAAIHRAEELAQ